jgi:hypothetical protein
MFNIKMMRTFTDKYKYVSIIKCNELLKPNNSYLIQVQKCRTVITFYDNTIAEHLAYVILYDINIAEFAIYLFILFFIFVAFS